MHGPTKDWAFRPVDRCSEINLNGESSFNQARVSQATQPQSPNGEEAKAPNSEFYSPVKNPNGPILRTNSSLAGRLSRNVKPSINYRQKHADYPIDQGFSDFTFLLVSTSVRRVTSRTKGRNRFGESSLTGARPRKESVCECKWFTGLESWLRSRRLE